MNSRLFKRTTVSVVVLFLLLLAWIFRGHIIKATPTQTQSPPSGISSADSSSDIGPAEDDEGTIDQTRLVTTSQEDLSDPALSEYPVVSISMSSVELDTARGRDIGPYYLSRLDVVEILIQIPASWASQTIRAHAPDGGLINGIGGPMTLTPSEDGKTLALQFTIGGHRGFYPLELEFANESLVVEFWADFEPVQGDPGPIRVFPAPSDQFSKTP